EHFLGRAGGRERDGRDLAASLVERDGGRGARRLRDRAAVAGDVADAAVGDVDRPRGAAVVPGADERVDSLHGQATIAALLMPRTRAAARPCSTTRPMSHSTRVTCCGSV